MCVLVCLNEFNCVVSYNTLCYMRQETFLDDELDNGMIYEMFLKRKSYYEARNSMPNAWRKKGPKMEFQSLGACHALQCPQQRHATPLVIKHKWISSVSLVQGSVMLPILRDKDVASQLYKNRPTSSNYTQNTPIFSQTPGMSIGACKRLKKASPKVFIISFSLLFNLEHEFLYCDSL